MTERAIICCPGPKTGDDWSWFGSDADWRPIYCVGLALLWAARCDYWVSADAPNGVHETCRAAFERIRPAVITSGRHVGAWREWGKRGWKLSRWTTV
jgi:hypothetical protein